MRDGRFLTARAFAGRAFACCVAAATTFSATTVAYACPSCPVGRTARQQVFDQDFGTNLLIAFVPFLLVGLVARWAEGLGSETSKKVEDQA